MTKPFKELRDEVVTDPERAPAIEQEKQRMLEEMDRYARDPEFRAQIDELIDGERRCENSATQRVSN